MSKIENVEFKVFYYLAFISFALGIAVSIPQFGLQRLLVVQPHSFAVFSSLCLLFSISHQLQKLVKKLT